MPIWHCRKDTDKGLFVCSRQRGRNLEIIWPYRKGVNRESERGGRPRGGRGHETNREKTKMVVEKRELERKRGKERKKGREREKVESKRENKRNQRS